MKNLIFLMFTGLILFISLPVTGQSNEQAATSDYQEIPDDAIRLRILANSNSDADQELKRQVRDKVNAEINDWVEKLTDIDEARQIIEDNVPDLESIVEEVLAEEDANQEFSVKYSDDVTFPAKLYGSYIYPAGEYEAVLITLGDGEGDNWWCVLFPPLCFLDFSSGTSVEEETDADDDREVAADGNDADSDNEENSEEDVEVRFFLLDWLGLS